MIEIFKGNWTLTDVRSNPNKIFIYGDNDCHYGLGGQAIVRNLPNTMGIRTKKKPSYSKDSYYTDREFELNKSKILQDINKIKDELMFGKYIVFSSGGYGTQRAKLKEKAPLTYKFLCDILFKEFNYSNELGKLIPLKEEIYKAKTIPMNYKHNKLGYGQLSPGQFRSELLYKGIDSTFEAIKEGYRCATSRNERFRSGDLVIFTSKETSEKLLCRVICDSYKVSDISTDEWSKLEGWSQSYFKLNPDVIDKYQFKFDYICSL